MFWAILFLHLLGATIWTGGHLVLSFAIVPRAVRAGDPAVMHDFGRGFMPLAMPALALQVLTGLWLALQVSPDWRDWLQLSDPVSAGIALKIALLVATMGIAMASHMGGHRHHGPAAVQRMARRARGMTALAVLFVATGAFLRTGGF